MGLDLHLHRFLHPSPLHLSPSLPLSLPPPPLSGRGRGVALVGLSASPDAAGGCRGNLLRTYDPCPGNPGHCLLSTAPAAPARRPDQGLVPESRHGVERLRSVPGRPHPLPVLPAARRGNVRLWLSPGSSRASAAVARCPFKVHLPPVCSSARCLDVPAAVFACTLPQVPLPAARRSSGLPGMERTLSGMVQTETELGLSWSARRGASVV